MNSVSKSSKDIQRYIEKGDPRIPEILEAYDHFLVELEVDISASTSGQILTEQVTLNGKPVTEVEDEKARPNTMYTE